MCFSRKYRVVADMNAHLVVRDLEKVWREFWDFDAWIFANNKKVQDTKRDMMMDDGS